jgi:hypothetical protein
MALQSRAGRRQFGENAKRALHAARGPFDMDDAVYFSERVHIERRRTKPRPGLTGVVWRGGFGESSQHPTWPQVRHRRK